jgi:hypothetical protein
MDVDNDDESATEKVGQVEDEKPTVVKDSQATIDR